VQYVGDLITTVNLAFSGLTAVGVFAAAILLTGRYRRTRIPALRFLALGFWLLTASVVLGVLDLALLPLVFPDGAVASDLFDVYTRASEALSLIRSMLNSAGLLVLAYGALRVRERVTICHWTPGRGQSARPPDATAEAIVRWLDWLRTWLID
jgi:hypothetical protein